jgi:hypothetical protein
MSYDELERATARAKSIRDHSPKWERLRPLELVNGSTREQIDRFCESKRISVEALAALEPRIAVRRGGSVWLAFAGRNGAGVVTAIKYRPLNGSSHDSEAEAPSVWLRPIIIGDRGSLDWFVAEGETDAARLSELVGDKAAVVCLPAGARAFKREWADLIPRGATVHLAHDADEDGDAGADKAAKVIGGKTVRVRPPDGDWCDWPGDRKAFVELVKQARAGQADSERSFALPIREFVALERPKAEPLIADSDGRPIIARHSLTLLGALGGQGKTTWFVDLALHLAAGVDYPPFTVPHPASILLVENEGPEEMFSDKLEARLASFEHELKARLDVHVFDWGGFSLADSAHRERLRQEIAVHEYDLVFGDPLDSLGIEGVGSPEDTRKFLELMKHTGLGKHTAWWLNTHPRKEETKEAINEIAGAWGGKPDAIMLLKMLADDRTQVRFPKLRWAKRGKRPAILLAFDAETEAFTYIGEESEVERDYLADVTKLLDDGKWRTYTEVAASRDSGGIGASDKTIKSLLEEHPERFESRTGDAAREVGRHANATVWSLRSTENQDDQDTPK